MTTSAITIPVATSKELAALLNAPNGATHFQFSASANAHGFKRARPYVDRLRNLSDLCGVKGELLFGTITRADGFIPSPLRHSPATLPAAAPVAAQPDFAGMSMKGLVSWYNAHSATPVTRFSDSKAAIRRCAALSASAPAATPELVEVMETIVENHPLNQSAVAAPKSSLRAAGVARSWADPAVAARRSVRDRVMVNGVEYRSVRAAFEAHGLPMKEHIAFRGFLKAAGQLDDYGQTWTILSRN